MMKSRFLAFLALAALFVAAPARAQTPSFCGDGATDPGEECDDGNTFDGDGCNANCGLEFCGDGIVTPSQGELCDDGNAVEDDGCQTNCTFGFCGDGIKDPDEECDDGNIFQGDGCSMNCTIEAPCGDGVQDPSEECDDGNTAPGDGCDQFCRAEICGDGEPAITEQCDDGNNVDGDGCTANCLFEVCGDGVVNNGGVEECDDGNGANGDGCNAQCLLEGCGDGVVQPPEECDDGGREDGDGCNANCGFEGCGDGVLQAGEECDDGDRADGDGCSAQCVVEFCGDGVVNNRERCDDGNTVDGDGCSSECKREGAACGPVAVSGHDGDDHLSVIPGGAGIYAGVFDDMLAHVTNAGDGVLAVGADPGTRAGNAIEAIAAAMTPPQTVAYANDAAIDGVNFELYAILYVPSDERDTNGGIEEAENEKLKARAVDVADFVNGGGGLFGFTQGEFDDPFGYLSVLGGFDTISAPPSGLIGPDGNLFDAINTTPAGLALGITDSNLDGCCYHNVFPDFPSYMGVLATAEEPTNPTWNEVPVFLGSSEQCIVVRCGDEIVQEDEGEECDDGGTQPGDGCDAFCQLEFCGDGVLQPGLGEECDDGNDADGDGCSADCEVVGPFCGDGQVNQTVEECDDGNTTSGDGCNSDCLAEFCGDGLVQPGLGEECDGGGMRPLGAAPRHDGEDHEDDGCGDDCLLLEEPFCGDGLVNHEHEECDDGNNADGDGCSANCTIETSDCECVDADGDGYFVPPPPDCAPQGAKHVQFDPECGPIDCDDSDPAIHPLAKEIPFNAVDENCNGAVSCGTLAGAEDSPWSAAVALLPFAAILPTRARRRR